RLALEEETTAGELDEFATEPIAQGPEFLVADVVRVRDLFPEIGRIDDTFPTGAGFGRPEGGIPAAGGQGSLLVGGRELAAPEAADGAFHPAEQVNAVGDVADGDLVH